MKEDFLHYIWNFKKFDTSNLKTVNGESLLITNTGYYSKLAGPDFFNAQITIDGQKWAGNVEIHIQSSDWYLHNHERDDNYDSVILHVVWTHDAEIYRKNNTEIPVLELKNYVNNEVLNIYQNLMLPKSWIYCEKQLASVSDFTVNNWLERMFFERLERKSHPIQNLLSATNNDWETVLFIALAKNFGLNTNGNTFEAIAQTIPFSIIRKECNEVENLEALLLGIAGLLDVEKEDNYFKELKFRYFYLLQKHQIEPKFVEPVQFFKHRPDNFPTIRLSQFAKLYSERTNLFSLIIQAKSTVEIYTIFDIGASAYWQNHYQFDKVSPTKKKSLSKSFIDLLIINTIIPIQFAYSKSRNDDNSEYLVDLLKYVTPENNSIISKFASFGLNAKNAFESQSLLQLKNEYCNKGKCLECAIGIELLKN